MIAFENLQQMKKMIKTAVFIPGLQLFQRLF